MKFRSSSGRNDHSEGWMRRDFLPATVEQANRRRLQVFLGTLVVALAISLGVTWLRPAEYRASARLEITPTAGSVPSGSAPGNAPESARPFLTEVQVLTSRPVLEVVATRLERSGQSLSVFGPDPIVGMQSQLQVNPVASTNVVELVATGQRPELLAPLLNTIVDVYRDRLAEAYRSSSGESLAQVNEEVTKLEATAAARRRAVEAFRIRHNIVSLERGENQVLAQVRNLSTSLSAAQERVAIAEGKLRALSESAAAGKSVIRARDDPTLANLEQRASQLREELRDLERSYTQDYLAKEPKAITQRARLSELERQIKVQREASGQAGLVEAQEELASAQGAAARLQSHIATGRQEVGQFTARFNEYKSQQDELGEIETAYRDAVQRRAKLEATERARMPTIKLLEAGTTPQEPWRPLYWRDTALGAGGSLVLALLAMWLVELFNRSEPQPTMVLVQPQLGGLPYETVPQALPWQRGPAMSLEASRQALLPPQPTFPRELRHDEVIALVRAADDDSHLVMLLLLSGVSSDEALALRWSDVDPARRLLHVGGGSARDVALNEALHKVLAARPGTQRPDLLLGHQDRPATPETMRAQFLCAAHDAGIADASDVTADCLRHTYVAFLVRQGIRFADLTRLVGHVPSEILGAYTTLSPPGSRVPREEIDVVFPAVLPRESV